MQPQALTLRNIQYMTPEFFVIQLFGLVIISRHDR